MNKLIVIFIMLFAFSVSAGEAKFTVTWNAVQNFPDLAGYKLRISTVQGNYDGAEIINTTNTSYEFVKVVPEGQTLTLYFTVLTLDTRGLESFPSNEAIGTAVLIRPPSTTITDIKVEVKL